MVTRTYDITIDNEPFLFGKNGGIELGNTLKEPSAPAQVDTVTVESLHHGAGRLLATDPYAYRDTNGKSIGADTRLPGHIMPGGAINTIAEISISNFSDVVNLQSYAAVFTTDDGDVVFGAGNQIITVEVTNSDNVTNSAANIASGHYFTGSAFIWNRDAWLGVEDVNYVSVGAYQYDGNFENTDANYIHSWGTSTRNGLFWIKNRDAANVPEFRWSDDTDSDFNAISFDANTGQGYGPFYLEIEKAHVTGMVSVGVYALFANKGGGIWGFDRNEVFLPLTPFDSSGYQDYKFGGPMQYVGNWVLVPNIDGLKRFDPRSSSFVDITPSVHQGSSPAVGLSSISYRAVSTTSTTPSGAALVSPFIGENYNALYLEMYEDGMFYHLAAPNIDSNVLFKSMISTRTIGGGVFTSKQVTYILGLDVAAQNWNVYRWDMPTASWQPGPANVASTSGIRTSRYTGRPPDVSVIPTQVRLGWCEADTVNDIDVWLEQDNETDQVFLGKITSTGPQVLEVPPDKVQPCRRFALAFNLNYTNSTPYVTMPINIDYRYAPVMDEGGMGGDFITLKFEASSEYIDRRQGRMFRHGPTEAEWAMTKRGQKVTLGLADREDPWTVVVEDAKAELVKKQDGRASSDYMVTLVCRRLS